MCRPVKEAAVLVAALVFLATCCQAQEAIVDDDETWNAFFRDTKSTPPFPYPGTMNFYDWDQYRFGFQQSMWDTKDFKSIIVIEPEYVQNATVGKQSLLWDYFWRFFDVYMAVEIKKSTAEAHVNWVETSPLKIWMLYNQLMKELYCCRDKHISLGLQSFGCWRTDVDTNCCVQGKWRQECKNFGLRVVKQWSSHSIQAMKFKFYKWLCIVYLSKEKLRIHFATSKNNSFPADDVVRACPDPCLSQPCNEIPNALLDSCRRTPGPRGFYRHEFLCQCREHYAFDVDSKQCQMKSMCNTGICSRHGTETCLDLAQGYKCICQPGMTGSTCSSTMNPCLSRLRTNEVAGNIACRVSEGNACIQIGVENVFMCECVKPFIRETSTDRLRSTLRGMVVPPDNCQAVKDVCNYVNCNSTSHGRCMPSGDLRTFVCVCDKDADGYPLYEGGFCELPVSQWLPWSLWSQCRPECGQSCFQARQRPCQHTEKHSYCKGTDEELRPCEPACRPCPNRSFVHLSGVFLKETDGPVLTALVSLFLVQLAVMAITRWAFSLDAMAP